MFERDVSKHPGSLPATRWQASHGHLAIQTQDTGPLPLGTEPAPEQSVTGIRGRNLSSVAPVYISAQPGPSPGAKAGRQGPTLQ
jgi:hypothetical protein